MLDTVLTARLEALEHSVQSFAGRIRGLCGDAVEMISGIIGREW